MSDEIIIIVNKFQSQITWMHFFISMLSHTLKWNCITKAFVINLKEIYHVFGRWNLNLYPASYGANLPRIATFKLQLRMFQQVTESTQFIIIWVYIKFYLSNYGFPSLWFSAETWKHLIGWVCKIRNMLGPRTVL